MEAVPQEISDALMRGATVLTGRPRAARTLRQAVDQSHRAAGMGSWAPARILTWDAWTSGMWHGLLLEGHADQMLMNRAQERALWRSIIGEDADVATLRDTASLAELAAEAWRVLAQYRGLSRLSKSWTNHDTKTFSKWAEVFQERCRERGYLTEARLEGALRQAWLRTPTCRPKDDELLLVGFDELPPARSALLDDLRASGCTVRDAMSQALPDTKAIVVAESEADEIRAAADWARRVLEERPSARIGLLVPGLKGSPILRCEIEQIFREALAPASLAITADEQVLPYEFSTGDSLDRTEIGAVALTLLDWTQNALELGRLSVLLLSPCFAGGGEESARAEFDAYELRVEAMIRPQLTLDGLIALVEVSGRRSSLLQLLASLRRMQAASHRTFRGAEHRSYSDWADAIRDLLGAAGWAVEGANESVTFQTKERWEGLLDELATLDFEGGRVSGAQAIKALREIAESTTFAPESREAPVQVMGPEEAAGLTFDAVWFLRAGDSHWPLPTNGNPLLSWPLRRELRIPGSDAAEDASRARWATERIAASAQEIIFSYSRQTATGTQKASAALAGFGLVETDAMLRSITADAAIEIEVVEDASRLPSLPDRPVQGGVGVLKAQAACAFHAFAEYRLFATELETRDPGLNASERGMAVHWMLEHFWADVGTQTNLKKMSEAERRSVLLSATNFALAKLQRWKTTSWDETYLEGQRRRLLRLGERWLELEAARAVPFTVERRESEVKNVAVGPLRLTLRLDRVDATPEGTVLIDYKTGGINSSAWTGDRPDEPQLPLYAALSGEMQLHGVAFGMVRPGDGMRLYGYADAPGTLSGKPVAIEAENLEAQVERWGSVLEGLATEFAEGDTRVSPKVYPGTCQYCAHRLICRLDVPTLHANDDEESFGSGEEERG